MNINLPQQRDCGRRYAASAFAACGVIALGVLLAAWPGSQQEPVQAASRKAQAIGAAVFHDKGCQHCHGDDATGSDRGPDLSTIGKRWHKDRIAQQIRDGGGGMPAFGDVLQPDEVKSLVDYLSAKRKAARRPAGANGGSADPSRTPAVSKPASDDSGA